MKELIKTKVDVCHLAVGMKVVELDRSWLETDFLMQGFIIQDQDDIDDIARQCEYVYVEGTVHLKQNLPERRQQNKGLYARRTGPDRNQYTNKNQVPATRPSSTQRINYINKVPVNLELQTARKNYRSAKSVAKNIMDGIRIGMTLNVNQAREAVDDVVESILRNDNALMWLSKLKSKDDYTVEHSLNVCILSITFARFLGHDRQEIKKIGLCALLHDVGKAKIPIEILNKPGRFTDVEFEIMKSHTTHGKKMLSDLPQRDLAALDVAYSHHERPDGRGYPRQLKAHQIPYIAQLVSLTDAYDAITSSRVYDSRRTSQEALDIIYRNRGKQFDEELAIEFIKCIGVYPPGSLVEMKNHEVGIVISSNKHSNKPKVLMVLDRHKKKTKFKIVNLLEETYDDLGLPYQIAREIPNESYGVDIKKFVEKGLQLKY